MRYVHVLSSCSLRSYWRMYWEFLEYSIVFLVECTTAYLNYLLNNLVTGYNT
jgi:hypothetical protein